MLLICLDHLDRNYQAILTRVDRFIDFSISPFSDLFDLLVSRAWYVHLVNKAQLHYLLFWAWFQLESLKICS